MYWVPDEQVHLPPEDNRTAHAKRPVLVLTNDDKNDEEGWPVVVVCPISSGSQASNFDVRIAANTGGLSAKGWARVCLIQPMDKRYVAERAGQVDASVVEAITANLLAYLGAI